jgi:hypothetical protein
MRIVTGASANHGRSLLQLLASLKRWARFTKVRVYDLGLAEHHIAAIKALGFELVRFPFEEYPAHFDIALNAGEYAWKPAIVMRELDSGTDPLIWMDSGNVLRRPLFVIRFTLATVGFYASKTSGTVEQWTHPGMYDALGIERGWAGDRSPLNGACIGFNTQKPIVRDLAKAWYEGALQKSVIAPDGSSRQNHRQDQALITLLAYRSGLISRPTRRDHSFRVQQDVPE